MLGLQQFVLRRLEEARRERVALDAKWDWNDVTVIGKGLPWKPEDVIGASGGAGSMLRYPLVRQRAEAAEFIAADALYPQNEVPVAVEVDDPDGAGPEEAPSDLGPTRRLKRWLKDNDAVGELQRIFRCGIRYGDAWGQTYATESRFGVKYGIEHVPNREAFPDWRREQPADGEYFFRVQVLRPWEALELFRGIEWVDYEAARMALRMADATPGSVEAARKGTGARRTAEVVQGWIRVPQYLLDGYVVEAAERRLIDFLSQTVVDAEEAERKQAELAVLRERALNRRNVEEEEEIGEYALAMVYLVGERLVGVLSEPGPCNVRRFVFREGVLEAWSDGMPDMLWELQDSASGSLQALDQGTKIASGALLGVDDSVAVDFTDVRSAVQQGKVLRLRSGEDIRKLVQLLQLPVDLNPIITTLNKMIELGDHFTPVQLVQAGQGQVSTNTAYELQQRLENAGRFLLYVVRNFARFASPLIDELFGYAVEMEGPEVQGQMLFAQASASFEASYLRKIEMYRALMALLQAIAQAPQLAARINWQKLVELLVEAFPTLQKEELIYREDDPALAAQKEAEEVRAQAEQALADAMLAKSQAEAARAQAVAQELESRLALNEARAEREAAAARVLDASVEREQALAADKIRGRVAQERREAARGPSVPRPQIDPGRAALLPGGDI